MSAPSAPPETAETATPSEEANLAPQTDPQTEAVPEGDRAVAPAEEAVASEPAAETQVELPTATPPGLSREEAERLFEEKAAVIRAAAIEEERNRRRTQAAREALAEKRAAEDREEARDTVKAAFGAQGYEIPDDTVYRAIDRVAAKKAQSLLAQHADAVETVFDHIVAPITKVDVEIDDALIPLGKQLAPKVQAFLNKFVPMVEAEARKGYIAESELDKHVQAEIARRNAQKREPETELQRVEGSPAGGAERGSIAWWNALGREGRALKENQLAYDAWLAKNSPH